MTFYYVYILQSKIKNFLYVGYTTNLRKRINNHNNGKEKSTKHYAPFELIFYEAYRSMLDAKRREEYFKTTKGKTTLRTILKEYFRKVKSF